LLQIIKDPFSWHLPLRDEIQFVERSKPTISFSATSEPALLIFTGGHAKILYDRRNLDTHAAVHFLAKAGFSTLTTFFLLTIINN
jgi:hypothetical protein